jgi:hypothetical protein
MLYTFVKSLEVADDGRTLPGDMNIDAGAIHAGMVIDDDVIDDLWIVEAVHLVISKSTKRGASMGGRRDAPKPLSYSYRVWVS